MSRLLIVTLLFGFVYFHPPPAIEKTTIWRECLSIPMMMYAWGPLTFTQCMASNGKQQILLNESWVIKCSQLPVSHTKKQCITLYSHSHNQQIKKDRESSIKEKTRKCSAVSCNTKYSKDINIYIYIFLILSLVKYIS